MKIVSASVFKAAHRADRKSTADLLVRKTAVFAAPELKDGEPMRFTITTEDVDREGDVIEADGWQLNHYLKNPVVLWGHDSSEPPIARSVRLYREGNALKSEVEFVPADVPVYGPRAEGIRQLCAGGFLFATSVGFRPLDYSESKDKDRDDGGWFAPMDFHKSELMEFSIVSIPANPFALIEGPLPNPTDIDAESRLAGLQAAAALERIKRERRARQQLARIR